MGALQSPAAVRVLRTESLPGCLGVPGGRHETPHGAQSLPGAIRGQPLTQPLQAEGWGWAEATRRGTARAGLAGRGAGHRWDLRGPPHGGSVWLAEAGPAQVLYGGCGQ